MLIVSHVSFYLGPVEET